MRTLGFTLLSTALVGMVGWSFIPNPLVLILLVMTFAPSEFFAYTYLFLLLIALSIGSYYSVQKLSKSRLVRIGLSALFLWSILVSYIGGAYLGELWAVYDAKSYLDKVVRSANEYLQKHGEYPESLDTLALPPMPRLVSESGNRKKNSAYFFITPYQRIDKRSIEVGFGYSKRPDECAMYSWTTKNPRWVCWCAGCLTDNPNG